MDTHGYIDFMLLVLKQQLAILYSSPSLSIIVENIWKCQNAIWIWSRYDERIKTDIETIENALDKTLLLRQKNKSALEGPKEGIKKIFLYYLLNNYN